MKNVAFHNLGCKVNSYEMDYVQQILREKGYNVVPFGEKADIYIINTCTVTNIADRKSRQMLHRAKKKNPDAIVVAVGCYVQAGGEEVLKDEGIDLAVGNNRKKDLVAILEKYMEAADGRFPVEGLKERVCTFIPVTCLRGVTWCAMAWVQYQQPDKLIFNESTYKKLEAYLSHDFLKMLSRDYF